MASAHLNGWSTRRHPARSTSSGSQPAASITHHIGSMGCIHQLRLQSACNGAFVRRSRPPCTVACQAALTQPIEAQQDATSPTEWQPSPTREWQGLRTWRARGIDRGRGWGDAGPSASIQAPGAEQYEATPLASSLVECAAQVLMTACPYGKAALTHRAWVAYNEGHIPLKPVSIPCVTSLLNHQPPHSTQSSSQVPSLPPQQFACQPLPERPARPERPVLVVPKQVPSYERGESPMSSLSAHMLHNLAHIELNAIDLAWDTVARWAGVDLPPQFYEDFARVADDESRHLGWCLQRLDELGHQYGDMPAHDLLWAGCAASSQDLTARLAVVPMSQEARGLDAGQRLVARLTGSGDVRTAGIVARISDEEHAHVAVGVAWFGRVCAALEVQAQPLFHQHLARIGPDLLKGPFHHHARQQVGLDRAFYDVNMWPAESAAAMLPPAKAAARRGKGLPISDEPAGVAATTGQLQGPQGPPDQAGIDQQPSPKTAPAPLVPSCPLEQSIDLLDRRQPGGGRVEWSDSQIEALGHLKERLRLLLDREEHACSLA